MNTKLLKSLKIFLFVLLSLIILWVAFYTVAWAIKINIFMKPFMEQHKNDFHKINLGAENAVTFESKATIDERHSIRYVVNYPNYDLFSTPDRMQIGVTSGNALADDKYHFLDDYAFGAMIWPFMFNSYDYIITVDDLKEANQTMTDSNVVVNQIWYSVDENLNLLDDGNTYTEHELKVWEENQEEIKEFWQKRVVDYFGEENVYK
ncbi:MAG: hypothetical protein LBM93_03875 [Oscillospiraceae bacterium]|jgi:hypothetical protein|nr:hypothetical protein [Oscillospiraceae bacterium]